MFDDRKASDNWAEIGYDRTVWIPVPLGFEGTKWADPAEWSFDYACQRFLQGGRELTRKVVKKEVLPLAETLLLGQAQAAGRLPAYKLLFPLPRSHPDTDARGSRPVEERGAQGRSETEPYGR